MQQLGMIEILEAFGIDCDGKGAADFVELVCRLASFEACNSGKTAPLNKIANKMAKDRGIYPQQFYGAMRRELLPLLEADEDTLAALGLRVEKRTTGQLARAFCPIARRKIERS